jgi:hypothetical protein
MLVNQNRYKPADYGLWTRFVQREKGTRMGLIFQHGHAASCSVKDAKFLNPLND